MIIAIEDALSEAVVSRIVSTIRPEFTVDASIIAHGKTRLTQRARELNRAADGLRIFLLLDLDTPQQCPADVIRECLGGAANDGLLFRIAVMEVESWILADRSATAGFLGIGASRIPMHADAIPNPKQCLVNLARNARSRDLRADLVPAQGSTAQTGPAYNSVLSQFVASAWDPRRAAFNSQSLRRAIDRLTQLPNRP